MDKHRTQPLNNNDTDNTGMEPAYQNTSASHALTSSETSSSTLWTRRPSLLDSVLSIDSTTGRGDTSLTDLNNSGKESTLAKNRRFLMKLQLYQYLRKRRMYKQNVQQFPDFTQSAATYGDLMKTVSCPSESSEVITTQTHDVNAAQSYTNTGNEYHMDTHRKPSSDRLQPPSVSQHQATRKPKFYNCYMCGKAYKQIKEYRSHIAAHKASSIFKCDICSCVLSKSSDYLLHINTHRRDGIHDMQP